MTTGESRRVPARAIARGDRYRSQLERDYAVVLEARRRAGELAWWAYETWKFEVGLGAWLTPDWAVQTGAGEIEIHETKGYMREAARVRLRAAVQRYPMFRWVLVRRDARGWAFEEVA